MAAGFIIAAAVGTVAAAVITGRRLVTFKTMAKYATVIDVGFSIMMLLMFAGTLTGMLVAIISGLLMALFLSSLRVIHNGKINLGLFTMHKPKAPTWLVNSRLQWPVKQHPDWATGNF